MQLCENIKMNELEWLLVMTEGIGLVRGFRIKLSPGVLVESFGTVVVVSIERTGYSMILLRRT